MAFGSTYSVGIQDSSAITPEQAAPYIYSFRKVTPYLNVVAGFSDFFELVAKKKKNTPDIFERSRRAGTVLDQMNILGVPMPKKIMQITKPQAKVIRAGSIPETFTFRGIDYTSSATSYEVVSPGRLIPKNAILQFAQDNGGVITIKINNVTPALDGGATLYFTVISGTLGNVTNTTTAKTMRLLQAATAEGGAVQAQDNQTATVATFGLNKDQTPVTVTTESLVTTYDTKDNMVVAGDAILPKLDHVGKKLNNTLLFAPSATTQDADGNTINIAPGIVNTSGAGSTSMSSTGLGPTNLEAMIDAITSVSSLDCDFETDGDNIVLDVFCGRTVKLYFDQMMHKAAAPFNTNTQTFMGDSTFDLHTNTWKGLSATLKIHYDRSFDGSAYASTLVMLNRNAIVPIWLKEHFFRLEESKAQTDSNKYTSTCTNKFGQVVLIPSHVQLGTGITGLES